MGLRKYQKNAVCAALDAFDRKEGKSLIHSPTGSGKSLMIKELVSRLPDQQTLIITPRIILASQLSKRFTGLDFGMLSASIGRDDGYKHRCIIATYQTLMATAVKKPNLIIIDECHLFGPGTEFERRINQFQGVPIIGFTATPTRGKDLIVDQGWKKIHEVFMHDLIDDGFLVRPVSMGTRGTDFSAGKDDFQVTAEIVSNLLSQVIKEGRKKVVVFCKRIEHAKQVFAMLKNLGEQHLHIVHSGPECKSSSDTETFSRFEQAPERSWLINVSKVSLGVDIPCIDAVAILRDVQHFATLAQMIGRGLRPHDGKKDCLVFDFGQGTRRFGFLDDPTFNVRKEHADALGVSLTQECPVCGRMHYFDLEQCPHCNRSIGHDSDRITATLTPNSIHVELLSGRSNRRLQFLTIDRISMEPNLRTGLFEARYSFRENQRTYATSFHTSAQSPHALKSGSKVRVEQVRGDLVRFI